MGEKYYFHSMENVPIYQETTVIEKVDNPTKIQRLVLLLAKKLGAIRARTFQDKVGVDHIYSKSVSDSFRDLVISLFNEKSVNPLYDDWVFLVSPETFMEQMKLDRGNIPFGMMGSKTTFKINGIKYSASVHCSEYLGVELFICPTISEPVLIPKTIAFKVKKMES